MVTSEPMKSGKRSTGRRSTEPRERPFTMSGEDVRATLAGLKTQARRAIEGASGAFWDHAGWTPTVERSGILWTGGNNTHRMAFPCPLGVTGDRLYVRETWAPVPWNAGAEKRILENDHDAQGVRYRATWDRTHGAPWRSPATMPRGAARLILTLTALRVERLQDITARDAVLEGVVDLSHGWDGNPHYPLRRFRDRWDRDHKRHPEHNWVANPWVWVPEFTVERVA